MQKREGTGSQMSHWPARVGGVSRRLTISAATRLSVRVWGRRRVAESHLQGDSVVGMTIDGCAGSELCEGRKGGKRKKSWSDALAVLYSRWSGEKADTGSRTHSGKAAGAKPGRVYTRPEGAEDGRALNRNRAVAENGRVLVNGNCPYYINS